MKINSNFSTIGPKAVNNYYQQHHVGSTQKNIKQQSQVKLSETAQRLVASTHDDNVNQDVDAAKVAKIKQQLAQGTYDVSPEKIAQKMFSEINLAGKDYE